VIWVGNYNHQALLCRWKVRQRLITLSNLPKNSAHVHVLSSRAHFTSRRAYILELICSILREPSSIVTYLKHFETCFLSFSAYILRLLPLFLSSFCFLLLFFLFLLHLRPPAFLHFIFLLLMPLLISHLNLSATTFLFVSVSVENLCCYAPFVGFNTSIHLLRFKSVRVYQRKRYCNEQTQVTDMWK